jgi:hypothetical protein
MSEIPKSEELKTKEKKRVRQIKTWGCAKEFFFETRQKLCLSLI